MAGLTMHGQPVTTLASTTGFTQSCSRARTRGKCIRLLKENGITYVAYDNAVRQGQFIKRPNEQLYATYFPKVFEDSRINGLVIYKVPDTPPPTAHSVA